MDSRDWAAADVFAVVGLDRPTADERRVGARIVVAVRSLASRDGVSPARGSTAALRLASAAANQVEPYLAALIAAEVASAAMAAPWLADDGARADATWTALRVVERLVPSTDDGDPGRDAGTWGAIGAAVALDASRGLDRATTVASLAASLVLEPVPRSATGHRYLALRAGHAASIAILAVTLADAGFVDDPQALATLDARLGLGPRSDAVAVAGGLAHRGIELLERAVA